MNMEVASHFPWKIGLSRRSWYFWMVALHFGQPLQPSVKVTLPGSRQSQVKSCSFNFLASSKDMQGTSGSSDVGEVPNGCFLFVTPRVAFKEKSCKYKHLVQCKVYNYTCDKVGSLQRSHTKPFIRLSEATIQQRFDLSIYTTLCA